MEIVREPKEFIALIPEYHVDNELKLARNKIGNYFILNDKDLNLQPNELFGFKVMKLQGIVINKDQALRFISGEIKPLYTELPDWYIEELKKIEEANNPIEEDMTGEVIEELPEEVELVPIEEPKLNNKK